MAFLPLSPTLGPPSNGIYGALLGGPGPMPAGGFHLKVRPAFAYAQDLANAGRGLPGSVYAEGVRATHGINRADPARGLS